MMRWQQLCMLLVNFFSCIASFSNTISRWRVCTHTQWCIQWYTIIYYVQTHKYQPTHSYVNTHHHHYYYNLQDLPFDLFLHVHMCVCVLMSIHAYVCVCVCVCHCVCVCVCVCVCEHMCRCYQKLNPAKCCFRIRFFFFFYPKLLS